MAMSFDRFHPPQDRFFNGTDVLARTILGAASGAGLAAVILYVLPHATGRLAVDLALTNSALGALFIAGLLTVICSCGGEDRLSLAGVPHFFMTVALGGSVAGSLGGFVFGWCGADETVAFWWIVVGFAVLGILIVPVAVLVNSRKQKEPEPWEDQSLSLKGYVFACLCFSFALAGLGLFIGKYGMVLLPKDPTAWWFNRGWGIGLGMGFLVGLVWSVWKGFVYGLSLFVSTTFLFGLFGLVISGYTATRSTNLSLMVAILGGACLAQLWEPVAFRHRRWWSNIS